jgi:multiple sugar transport system ATP-binding protein
MATIELIKVSKRFPDGTVAVEEADFRIEDGEFFILVGPSGCGKSTLLNMIVGLEEITSGELRVDGELFNHLDPKDRNMAMVFQSYAIYPHMTVRENMAFPLRLAKLPQPEIDRRVEEAARILELTDHLGRKPGQLSGGQRQRVAMGRAIVREPLAFLMDEPLSNLDAKLRVQMRTEIARLQNRLGTTTVYVTHDQTEAMTLGDRVAIMSKGVVQQVGTPRELYTDPANLFVAGFIGSPAMNFLPAALDGNRLRLPMVDFDLPADTREALGDASGDLVAGIRPEHFEDAGLLEAESSGGCTFRATVDVVEWMGSELYAYFEVEGHQLVARLDADSGAREGEALRIWLDPHQVRLFDARTGEHLTRRKTAAVQ